MTQRNSHQPDNDKHPVGYRRPPKATQFPKGKSGNPRGRPKGLHRDIPYEHVLGQMVMIRDGDQERRVTAAEAFILHLTSRGLAGDSAATQASLQAIEAARARNSVYATPKHYQILVMGVGISPALKALGLTVRKHPTTGKQMQWSLNSWIVNMALARLGDTTLSEEDQQEIWNVTRAPEQVVWPDWWVVRG